ncbi:AAA family ATPase [Sulfurimonas sp.]|uniref:AAA family ATPase n=1 Tax=Sulfurimonas sp. TaxID=2022749 RepID=UPI00356132FB
MIKWFIENYSEYVTQMRECSYHSNNYTNLHHLEGDVWSHTMLSFSKGLNFEVSKVILLSLFFHDIGRIKTRHINKDGSLSFGDFEGVSCFIAVEMLNKLDLSENEKVKILKIIMYQYNVIDFVKYDDISWEKFVEKYKYDEELVKDLFSYVKCDLFGRFIDKSKAKYYNLNKILTYEKKASSLNIQIPQKDIAKKDVYILVGLPCAGKSTWIEQNFPNSHVISRDDTVSEIGKRHNVYTYDESSYLEDTNEDISREVDALYNQLIKESFEINLPVIIDNTSVTISKRKKWIDKYKDTHNVYAVVFLKSYQQVIDCNTKRTKSENKTVDHETILKQMINFRIPMLNEGFCEVKYVFN